MFIKKSSVEEIKAKSYNKGYKDGILVKVQEIDFQKPNIIYINASNAKEFEDIVEAIQKIEEGYTKRKSTIFVNGDRISAKVNDKNT